MLRANDPLIEGVTFTIGGEPYIAPPLTLGGIKAVLPRLTGNAAEVLSVVLCVSLKRNYSDATQPWLDETMTGGEFRSAAVPPCSADADQWIGYGRKRFCGGSSGGGLTHIYGMLATVCGYSFDLIDAMTMAEFELLCDYWRDHPPLHLLAAGYLGIKKPRRQRRPQPI